MNTHELQELLDVAVAKRDQFEAERDRLREVNKELLAALAALESMTAQPTMNPLAMTPEQRRTLWAAHSKAHAAIAKAGA